MEKKNYSQSLKAGQQGYSTEERKKKKKTSVQVYILRCYSMIKHR